VKVDGVNAEAQRGQGRRDRERERRREVLQLDLSVALSLRLSVIEESVMAADDKMESDEKKPANRKRLPELWQVVVECRDEAEQREVYERMRAEGRKVRVQVL